MGIQVGIPRAMLYHYYQPLWENFFRALGAEVVVSPPTTKEILDRGVELAVDEACLPVKLFFGHADFLRDKVDYIFAPRVVSVEPKKYTCPKLLGLPDMVGAVLPRPPLIDVTVNLSQSNRDIWLSVYHVGRLFTKSPWRIYRAWRRAVLAYRDHQRLLYQGCIPGYPESPPSPNLRVAVIGHAYNLYDAYISMNIIKKLHRWGVGVVTPEMLPRPRIDAATARLGKDLFWTYCKQIMGTAYHFLAGSGQVNGIIQLVTFGCGPDSLTGELVEREAQRRKHLPFMLLTIDEHTGEAGLLTRLEAFFDMIRWREQRAGDFSLYGHNAYSH